MALKLDKLYVYFFFLPFFLDRITKYWIVSGFWAEKDVTSFFEIYLTYNKGIAWGIGQSDHPIATYSLIAVVAAIILYYIKYLLSTHMHYREYAASLLILSGAVSNFFDRFYYPGVVDFIRLHYGQFSFAVFNVADMAITFGVIYIFVHALHFERV